MGKSQLVLLTAFAAGAAFAARFDVRTADEALTVRDRVRAARQSGQVAAGERVEIVFHPGAYVFERTVELDASDSGSAAAPVVWRAERSGAVRLLGGRPIPRTAFAPVAEASVRARLDPSVRDRVLVCDASPYLVKEPPRWRDYMSGFGKGGAVTLPGPWLYRNGEPLELARWPNADAPEKGWFGYTNLVEAGSPSKPGAFEFPGDRAARWNVAKGVWLNGYWHVDWLSEFLRLGAYDASNHVARVAASPTYNLGPGRNWTHPVRRFYALNLLEELDAPGEWYLDRDAKRLYWLPGADDAPSDELVLAQETTPFFRVRGATDVVFDGLSFEYSHGECALQLEGTTNCTVRGCAFLCHAGGAVRAVGAGNRITGARMRNLGGTAVTVEGGDSRTLLPANNLLDHSTIERYALFQRTMAAGIVVKGCGNAVRNCLVRNGTYIALTYRGNEHLIADNEFDDVVHGTGDSGCIYSGHNASWLGTVIFGNYIHDLAFTPSEKQSINGVYFDDCDWGDDVIGNVFERAGQAVLIGGGKLHGVYNNLMADCSAGVYCDARGFSWRTKGNGSFFWDETGRTYGRRRQDEAGVAFDRAPWSVAYPRLREAIEDHPQYPFLNVVTNNVMAACERPFAYVDSAHLALGTSSPGNVVTTNAAARPLKAPQPIRLDAAVENALASADGGTVATFGLDASAHFRWTLRRGGAPVLASSPLGITVGDFDCGHRVVPGKAEPLPDAAIGGWTNATELIFFRQQGQAWKNVRTQVKVATTARAWRIPLKSLITAETVAFLEVRIWTGGVAFRWIVPGTGRRRIAGENSAFSAANPAKPGFRLVEWERDGRIDGYPESFFYTRAPGVKGVSFPEAPHGWTHTGEVVSPWRGVLVGQ